MPFPTIARFEDRNYTGICYFDVVDVADVVSVPQEVGGNIATDVVLADGVSWSRVYLEDDGGTMREQWLLKDGDQYSDAEAGGAIAKDRLALMPNLWALKGQRYLVRFTNQNGDTLLMGNLETPAMARVNSRDHGDTSRMESERNEYRITFGLVRRSPVPFYGGTVSEPVPEGCPTAVELLGDMTAAEIETALIAAGQLVAVQGEICAAGGDATVRTTDDATDVMIIPGGTSDTLPQSVMKYKTALNANAETDPSNTDFDGTTLRPNTQVPRRALVNSVPTGYGFATLDGLLNNTLPAAPDAVYQLQNSVPTNIGSPQAIPAGVSVNIAAPDVSIGINGNTGLVVAPAGTTPDIPVVDEDDNPVGSWDTDRWRVTVGAVADPYYALAIGA